MTPDELWRFLPIGYVASVLVELPVLWFGLATCHPRRTRLLAAFWLTACTYPIVVLVLPLALPEATPRWQYLAITETFAPVAECLLFWLAWGGEIRDRRSAARHGGDRRGQSGLVHDRRADLVICAAFPAAGRPTAVGPVHADDLAGRRLPTILLRRRRPRRRSPCARRSTLWPGESVRHLRPATGQAAWQSVRRQGKSDMTFREACLLVCLTLPLWSGCGPKMPTAPEAKPPDVNVSLPVQARGDRLHRLHRPDRRGLHG